MTPNDRARCLALILCLLHCSWVGALNVTFDSNARLAEDFNSNLFLKPGPHEVAWGQGIDGGMTLTAIKDDWRSAVSANFENRWYVTDRNLDYFNQFFSWQNNYFTDRSKYDLNVQYNNDTTLTSLADQTSSLGYVFERVPRTDKIVSPRWSYSLTPRTLMNIGYTFRDSVYENSTSNDRQGTNIFPDSYSHLGSVDLIYDWSKRLKLLGSSYYSYYALTFQDKVTSGSVPVSIFPGVSIPFPGTIFSPAITSDIQTANWSLGFRYLATETIDVNFTAGIQRNQTHRPAYTNFTEINLPDGSTQRGPNLPVERLSSNSITEIFDLGINKHFQTGMLGFQYSRTITPNLLGDLITYDRIALVGQHQFTAQISNTMNLSYYDQTFPGGNTQTSRTPIAQTITRYGLESTLNWMFERNWTLSASYRFFYQDYGTAFGNSSNTAMSHGVYLTIQHLFDQQRL